MGGRCRIYWLAYGSRVLEKGHEVVIADNLITGYKQAVPKEAIFYQGDIRDYGFLNNLFKNEKIDAVIHFAAFSLVGESVSIYGTDYDTPDGTCIRDYIHVTDLAEAHILAVEYLMKGGESNVFNLGNGVGYSVREVIETARKVTGHPIPAVEIPRRAGDPARLVASGEKAKTVLGWEPKITSLEDIIRSAWVWHSTHPNGYNEI